MTRFVTGMLLTAAVILAFAWIGVLRYPAATMQRAMAGIRENAGGEHRFFHERLADETWRTIVRPSPDLLYSALAYDLSKGALVVELPGHDDYWVLQMVADNTDSYAYFGSASHGATPVLLYVSQDPRASAPEGYRVVHSPSRKGVLLLRYLVRSPEDFTQLDRLRKLAAAFVMNETPR